MENSSRHGYPFPGIEKSWEVLKEKFDVLVEK
jgi:hypothetical protein